jgi:phosphatidylinositol alpha-1,6-mannosyltransferase
MHILRILSLLTDAYGGYGGIAAYNRDLIEAFCSHAKIDSVVAFPRVISQPLVQLPAQLDYRLSAANGMGSYLRATAREAFSGRRPDIIYCAHVNLAPLAMALRARWGSPVLLALYGIEAWRPTGRAITDLAASRADGYYAISETTRQRFSGWSSVREERIDLLPNAIHLKRYGMTAPDPALVDRLGLSGRKVLLTLGRLVSKDRAKGFDEVIDALPAIRAQVPEAMYVIAGQGEYRPTLEAKVKARGLEEHVVFTGFVEEDMKADLYRTADVYIMPSRGEGFGFVFLEAMACGVPCVASAVDGSRDAVRNGALGALVDPSDKEGLVHAVVEALAKPRKIPSGLSYFAFPAFETRVHALIDDMTRAKRLPA